MNQCLILMLLLAYLTTRNKDWQAAEIRVLAPSANHPTEQAMQDFHQKLEDARIDVEPEIVLNANISNVIAYSPDAALVFLPFLNNLGAPQAHSCSLFKGICNVNYFQDSNQVQYIIRLVENLIH